MIHNPPKSAGYKIAFTGTNSSGKTTTALEVTARLKAENHYLAEVVSSQDRKVTWKDDHFPVDPRAHYGMISGLIYAEVAAELKGDANVVITDRSVLDLYAIALTDHPHHPMVTNMLPMIKEWMSTYSKVFYLPPLEYQEDGKRPPNEFRLRTHATLMKLLNTVPEFSCVERITDRSTIMGTVRKHLGIGSPHPAILELPAKMQWLANKINVRLFVKDQAWSNSDLDIWVMNINPMQVPGVTAQFLDEIRAQLAIILGSHVNVHLMYRPDMPGGFTAIKAIHKGTEYVPEPITVTTEFLGRK